MKISKLRIKNIFGITEFNWDGKNIEATGQNGAAKSSIIDAIKLALQNKSSRDFILRTGETEGELLIETDSGLTVTRKPRTGKSDYSSVKDNGEEVPRAESFLRQLFTELQLNPVQFLEMDAKEQNRIILDLIEFKWDMAWIKKQFGEIVPDVDYEQNILRVLQQIQSDDGYYFLSRQEVNRDARNKIAFIEEIAKALPEKYTAETWEAFNLAELYKKIEKIRHANKAIEDARAVLKNQDNKLRGFQADRDIEVAALDKETTARRTTINTEIEKLKAQILALETEAAGLEEKRQDKLKVIEQTYKANVAEHETLVNANRDTAALEPQDFSALQAEATEVERMKGFVNEYRRMVRLQEEVDKLRADSERFTELIEHARALPGEILKEAQLPIDGLTVKDGVPLINGRPINNLSSGEQLSLCVDVATSKTNALNLLLIDGTEKLSTANRDALYAKCKAKGVQFIATRTTDDADLIVTEI